MTIATQIKSIANQIKSFLINKMRLHIFNTVIVIILERNYNDDKVQRTLFIE